MLKTGDDFARAIDFLNDLVQSKGQTFDGPTAEWLIENLEPTSKPMVTFAKALLRTLPSDSRDDSSRAVMGVTPNGVAGYVPPEEKRTTSLPIHVIGNYAVIHGLNWARKSLIILPRHFATMQNGATQQYHLSYRICRKCSSPHPYGLQAPVSGKPGGIPKMRITKRPRYGDVVMPRKGLPPGHGPWGKRPSAGVQ